MNVCVFVLVRIERTSFVFYFSWRVFREKLGSLLNLGFLYVLEHECVIVVVIVIAASCPPISMESVVEGHRPIAVLLLVV